MKVNWRNLAITLGVTLLVSGALILIEKSLGLSIPVEVYSAIGFGIGFLGPWTFLE